MSHLLSPDPPEPLLFGTTGFVDAYPNGIYYACNRCKMQVLFPQEMPREEIRVRCCDRWVYLIPREDS